jgi:hypothetical protein
MNMCCLIKVHVDMLTLFKRVLWWKMELGADVKTHYVFINDPIKIMCFEHKTRMKVDHRIKILKLCRIDFFTNKFVIFYEAFLSWIFYVWASTHFLFFHYGLHLLKMLHNKWCSPHYVCIMWKEKIERFNEPQKERCNILLIVLPMYFHF